MRDVTQTGRLLGYVQVQVGSKMFAVPVQAVKGLRGGRGQLSDKGGLREGGFFTEESGVLGILVDDDAPEKDVQAQIARGSVEAVRHLSRRHLN
jgi:hypothetical protein